MASASVFDVDVELRARYRCDVSPLEAVPAGVARARDVADVIAAIDEARGQGVGLLPVGAQTSTTGASVAVHGGLIVDLSALDSAPILDSESMTVRVRPGTRVGALRHWLKERGFDMPVDPTSQHECTVGGAIATNASGPATFAHGSMRDWVVGLDVVDGQSERHEFRRCGRGRTGDPT